MSVQEGGDVPQSLPGRELLAGFSVGEWRVEPLSGCFKRGDNRVHVEPKVMDVLICLASARGDVVTREQLLERVWTGLVVSEEVLTRAVSELRTLLGDTHRERRYVRTIPKRGYALIADVRPAPACDNPGAARQIAGHEDMPPDHPVTPTEEREPAPAGSVSVHRRWPVLAAAAAVLLAVVFALHDSGGDGALAKVFTNAGGADDGSAATATAEPPTLAVMPFINLSGQADEVFLSEGLSEDIRNALISVPGIKVVARTSSQAFKDQALDVREIGRRLGVASLVEGTVRIQNGNARITIQLTNTSSGFPIWSQSYDRAIDNVFSVQREISEAVVGRVAPQLAPRLPQQDIRNQDAHNLYLLGRHFWHQRTPEGIKKALEKFSQAVAIDPQSAMGYSGLADAYLFSVLYADMDHGQALTLAQENASRALALDPNLAAAHASQGLIYEYQMQFQLARESFDRSVTLNPSNTMARMWLGNVLLSLDEVTAAYQQYQQALEIDPLHPVIKQNFLEVLIVMGRYDEAIRLADQMYQTSGEERLLKISLRALAQAGRYDELLRFAVRYNFSKAYERSATATVADALINLQRFKEAELLLGQRGEPATDDHWAFWKENVYLRARLALAQRDSEALRGVIASVDSGADGAVGGRHRSAACARARMSYWSGIADYMDADFARAVERFGAARAGGFLSCHFDEDTRISLLIYLGDSQNLIGDSAAGAATLRRAQQRLDRAVNKGWGHTSVRTSQIALNMIDNDIAALAVLSTSLQREGVQPWSNLISHPIFDRHLQRHSVAALLTPFKEKFLATRASSTNVKLAKFGL
ncbi:winged helix-turn-helix domain-containing protein [Exilibacterium tricleocarpae]|nr:winged helix-turn-helix domain-containing protein [Exilibacterium tricleocarpae]